MKGWRRARAVPWFVGVSVEAPIVVAVVAQHNHRWCLPVGGRTGDRSRIVAPPPRLADDAADQGDHADLIASLDRDLYDIALNQVLPAELGRPLGRMLDLGAASAVFVLPPGPVR